MKEKNTGKSPEKRRRPVKRLVEISEDVYKLKLPEQFNFQFNFIC